MIALELAAAFATFVALSFIVAPYGRHARPGWGPTLPARLGWLIMESPAAIVPALFFPWPPGLVSCVLLLMWEFHYIQRAWIFPWRVRSQPMPVLVVALAIAFNSLNGVINGAAIASNRATIWLADPRFIVGAALFFVGFVINHRSDAMLLGLRATGYAIPRGGLFERVSCPNYLGEIIEWIGWALASWSLAGLAFALYTIANLAPRALAHHRWYKEKFADYPPERKALIPGVI